MPSAVMQTGYIDTNSKKTQTLTVAILQCRKRTFISRPQVVSPRKFLVTNSGESSSALLFQDYMKTGKNNNFGDVENVISLPDANNVDCKTFYFLLFKFSKTKKIKCHFNQNFYILCFFSPT